MKVNLAEIAYQLQEIEESIFWNTSSYITHILEDAETKLVNKHYGKK